MKSVLFVCNMNSVRSPMAAALMKAGAPEGFLVDSAGVYEGGPDPFVEAVLREVGVEIAGYEPKSVDDVRLGDFDLAVALTPEAYEELHKRLPEGRVEFWNIDNPSLAVGGRDAILAAYRDVRDDLARRLSSRFKGFHHKP